MATVAPRKQLTGVVVSAGKMIKTVKVRVANQQWNKRVQKYYAAPKTVMVSDPTSSVREGDVVTIEGGHRASKHVRHVVSSIVSPMGPPVSERPPIPSAVERAAAQEAQRAAGDIRQAIRGSVPARGRILEHIQRDLDLDVTWNTAKGVMHREKHVDSPAVRAFIERYRGKETAPLEEFIEVAGLTPKSFNYSLERHIKALERKKAEFSQVPQKLELGPERRRREGMLLRIITQLENLTIYGQKLVGNEEAFRQNAVSWFEMSRKVGLTDNERRLAALALFGRKAFKSTIRTKASDEALSGQKEAEKVDEAALDTQRQDIEALAVAANKALNMAPEPREGQSSGERGLPEDAVDAVEEAKVDPVEADETERQEKPRGWGSLFRR